MTTFAWAKLWIETLDDFKMGQLPDHLWRRFFEFVLLAVEHNRGGWLPNSRTLAKRLNTDLRDIDYSLNALNKHGLVGHWDTEPWARRWYQEMFGLEPGWGILRFDRYCGKPIPTPPCDDWLARREIILERDSWQCRYCGEYATHVDHVIPRCQGGSHDLDNLVAACTHCNCTKGGRTPEQAGMELING